MHQAEAGDVHYDLVGCGPCHGPAGLGAPVANLGQLRSLIIIMEYVPGGSLASLLKKFTALKAGPCAALRAIVRGMSFLHRSDVIHQDIKPVVEH